MMLPVLATANDIRELVQFLKKRPEGVNTFDVVQPIKKRLFYPPKIAAFEFWGIVMRQGDRVTLTQLGWEFARNLEPEAKSYRTLLDKTAPYKEALHWAHHQKLELVTEVDLANFWQSRFPETFVRCDKKKIKGNVVCFFHLCQAAEFGTMTMGKRGQPARLRLMHGELLDHLEIDTLNQQRTYSSASAAVVAERPEAQLPAVSLSLHQFEAIHRERLRVYVSYGQVGSMINQIRETLRLSEVAFELVERSTNNPQNADTVNLEAMHRCHAGIIMITRNDCLKNEDGTWLLRDQILSEIGAAFIHYEHRIALVWEDEIPMPNKLRDIRRCKFKNETLTWDSGIELMRAMRDFTAEYLAIQNV